MAINPELFRLAQEQVWKQQMEKAAVGAGAAPGDSAGGGAGMMGGAPPGGGMQPGMGGMMAGPGGGMQQMAMQGMQGMGMGMDPSGAMGGMMGGGMPQQGAAPQKIKPEQWMQQLDYRLYNMQQLMTALCNQMQVQIPPGALVMPPGTPMAPPMESALPGGPADPMQMQGGQGGAGGGSAIGAIEPMQGASPELAQAGGGAGAGAGGGAKMASAFLDHVLGEVPADPTKPVPAGQPYQPAPSGTVNMQTKAAAVAALLRSRNAA
jgi:hypothetical protein